MEAKAYLRGVRISPRKVQIVLDLIRNKPTDVALAILRHTPKAASEEVQPTPTEPEPVVTTPEDVSSTEATTGGAITLPEDVFEF